MTGLAISHSSPPQKESKLQCDVCNMIFSGPESQNQHNSSEKHKKKMQATAPSQNAANQSSLSWKESKLECHICDMTFSGPESQKQHNDSEKHKKKASQMFPNTQNINLSCDVCSMTFTGPESKEQHLDSDKHKKKVQSAQMFNLLAPADPAPSQQLRCDECSMTFTGPESLGQHLNGEKHRKKLQQKMLDGTKLGENAQQKTFSDQVSVFWCKPCNITCTSKVSLAEHEASRNHAKMISV